MDIDGAVVLVTGASSGIGAATARAASQAGARVVLAARREDRIRQLADELGAAVHVRCDVTDSKQVAAAVDAATSAFGRIDVMVNNAGQGLHAALEQIDPEDFRARPRPQPRRAPGHHAGGGPGHAHAGRRQHHQRELRNRVLSASRFSRVWRVRSRSQQTLRGGASRARRRRHRGLDDVPIHHGHRVHRITPRRNRIRVAVGVQPGTEAAVPQASR